MDSLSKRDDRVFCGCGFNMNKGDCDAAVANLKDQFGSGNTVPADLSWYAISGSVVAFMCNYGGEGPQWMSSAGFAGALEFITQECGEYIAGSIGDTGIYSNGYMRYSDGLNFCANALASPASSC
jgi:hypothetical protein